MLKLIDTKTPQALHRFTGDISRVAAMAADTAGDKAPFWDRAGFGPDERFITIDVVLTPPGVFQVKIKSMKGESFTFMPAHNTIYGERVSLGSTHSVGNAHGLNHFLSGLVAALWTTDTK